MKRAIFYDTETTGLPIFLEPSEDPRQPHIVQLAAMLVDLDTRSTIASMDMIIRPEGWTVPDDVAAIHGITTAFAAEVGASASVVISAFLEMWSAADIRIGHNESFDDRMLRIALHRHHESELQGWANGPSDCTASLATRIMKLPPTERMRAAGRNRHKRPSLTEAVRHFCGREHENAHTAMADVIGCRDVWFAIRDAESTPRNSEEGARH